MDPSRTLSNPLQINSRNNSPRAINHTNSEAAFVVKIDLIKQNPLPSLHVTLH